MTDLPGRPTRSTHRLLTAVVMAVLAATFAPMSSAQNDDADAPVAPPPAAAPGPAPVKPVPPGESGIDLTQMIRHSATGLILPNVPVQADLDMTAGRTTAWEAGDTHRILLENDVKLAIGSYGFRADRAVVLISPYHKPGVDAHSVAVYLDHVRELGGYGPVQQEAKHLLVTAVISGKVTLNTDLMQRQAADNNALVEEAIARVGSYEDSIRKRTVPLQGGVAGAPLVSDQTLAMREQRRDVVRAVPKMMVPPPYFHPPGPQPVRAGSGEAANPQPGQVIKGVEPVASPKAQVDFSADKVVYKQAADKSEGYVLLMGNITVMYVDPVNNRRLTLTADKAVVFTDPDLMHGGPGNDSAASKIHGVYLEDNVIATDGQYTLRGPRIYYDLRTNQAVVLNAVFFTYDVTRKIPLYVRAREIRQHSTHEWSAENAKLTTGAFFTPHFSIGADQLTVSAQQEPGGAAVYNYTAKGVRMNLGDSSVFYWPSVSGNTADIPLREIDVGGSGRFGATVRTKWDLLGLLNQSKPAGVDATLLVDGYSKRGPGVGIDMKYDVANAFGDLKSYYLFDEGQDEPGGREKVDPLSENRGRVLWRHRHELGDDWEATAQFSYLSDPTFLEEFYTDEANASKEEESSIYFKQQRNDWAFSFLTKYDLNNFVSQLDLLQTRGNARGGNGVGALPGGYTTQKLPELAYYRIGTSLWDDKLTWFSENRGSVLRLNLPGDNPQQRGFTSAQSLALFGIASNTTPFDAHLAANGLDENTRYRIDTRQELDAPLKVGDVNVVPYGVGRVTAYSDDFDSYNGGSTSNTRLWGSLGLRAATTFSAVYSGVNSDLFDVHKIRHIFEPSINLFYAETNVNQEQLPVYDYDVESLAEGGVMKIGLHNTFQTQRGGEDNWRSVDWLRIDTDFVFATDQIQRESPIARFFSDRPEMSLVGNYVYNEIAWQASDTFAVVNELNYNFDSSKVEQWNLGFQLDHSPRLSSFASMRMIDALNSLIVTYGMDYLMTPKYHVSFAQSFDVRRGETRNITVALTRRLPRWQLIVMLDYDTVGDVASAGVALVPEGLGGVGNAIHNPFLFNRP